MEVHGLEGEGEVITQPGRVRANYLEELEKFVTGIKRAYNKSGVEHVLVNAKVPIEQTILPPAFCADQGK